MKAGYSGSAARSGSIGEEAARATAVQAAGDLEGFRLWFNDLPVMRALGVRCTELGADRAIGLLDVQPHHRNPNGSVNGGFLLAAADVTAGAAVASGSLAGSSATNDLTMHFLAPAVAGPLTIEAEVLRRGRRNCVPTVRITDAAGSLCAIATGTWVLPSP